MKIIELQIRNIRGIRSLDMTPSGQNIVIWGPNGAGKSAVVDAIDFLLTGRIARLTGPGTRGITLRRHGPHIDADPQDAEVRALVQLPGLAEMIELKRHMANPGVLIHDPEVAARLQPILLVANRRLHMLSRKEILSFITSESASRAEQIQELLDLSEVEEVRRALVSVANESDQTLEANQRSIERARASINVTAQTDVFSDEAVVAFVNHGRKVLGAEPISRLGSDQLKQDISLPRSVTGEQSINVSVLERDFQNLGTTFGTKSQQAIMALDSQLRALLSSIRSDPRRIRLLQKRELLRLGLSLIEETGECPLCGKDWPIGELKSHLETHLEEANAAREEQGRIAQLSGLMVKYIDNALASLDKLSASLKVASLPESAQILRNWAASLRSLSEILSDPMATYPASEFVEDQVKRLLAPEDADQVLNRAMTDLIARYPEASPEQTAWDSLTRLEENFKALESAQASYEGAVERHRRAHALHDHFVAARDEVLWNLYREISLRFSELYRHLHGPDENYFEARIAAEGPGLSFGVDFYGRGIHPPHALHSEGHQDSMGICLYMALAERLTKGIISFKVLDDVVMSVDSSHRRKFCTLLSEFFPNTQFIITTHDRTWANQLRTEGLVSKDTIIEFYNWDIETGPYVNLDTDLWQRVDTHLRSGDISGAAALMRTGSESFFAFVCDSFESQVRFRLDGRNDLGDFLPSAVGAYNSRLRSAKKAAQSWSQQEAFDQLNELASTASQIYQRTLAEQWTVNAAIHFNNWANLGKEDFIPIREAFQDLHALFVCQNCGAVLHLAKQGPQLDALRCGCGQINWNLVEKSTS